MSVRLAGRWSDGHRPGAEDCVLQVRDDGTVLLEPALAPLCQAREITCSPPLGNTPRYLSLPDGSQFETADHAGLAAWAAQHGLVVTDPVGTRVHRLEAHWVLAIASACLLLLSLAWFGLDGMPRLAKQVALHLPPAVTTYIGRDTLAWLDRMALGPSTLDAARQQQLQAVFAGLLPEDSAATPYRLLFRQGGEAGANAFALPDATIVVTDELVALAESDHEIAVVMLHEIGHVEHRHLLRQMLQHAGLAAMLALVVGDVGGASELVLAAPGLLLQARYSQAMEIEADDYARLRLAQHGLPPAAFVAMLSRLDAARPGQAEEGAWQYLSTHPQTEARIRRFSAGEGVQ